MDAQGWTALGAAVLFAALVLGFSSVAARLNRMLVTAPLAFVTAGAALGFAVGQPAAERVVDIKVVAEVTLVLILFHDAAQVRPREIGSDGGVIARLLLVGFPLTVLVGYLLARVLFPDMSTMLALLLAASLAPTDAGLGAATVLNPIVPMRVRRMLNVESGLNDGLATPIVLFAVAVLAGAEGLGAGESLGEALVELVVGALAGTLVGVAGGLVLGWSRRRDWSTSSGRALGVLMIPLLAYGSALALSGNGFVAAFVSGSAFAGAARWIHSEHSALELTEALANPLGYAVWFVFGLAAVPFAWDAVGWREALFAVLALTALRMGPVAVCLIGSGFRAPTVLFVGWFGPRGLASVVFALLSLESLDPDPGLRVVLATIAVTVLLSVTAHGFSAAPLADRYGLWVRRTKPAAELEDSTEPRARGARLAAGAHHP